MVFNNIAENASRVKRERFALYRFLLGLLVRWGPKKRGRQAR